MASTRRRVLQVWIDLMKAGVGQACTPAFPPPMFPCSRPARAISNRRDPDFCVRAVRLDFEV